MILDFSFLWLLLSDLRIISILAYVSTGWYLTWEHVNKESIFQAQIQESQVRNINKNIPGPHVIQNLGSSQFTHLKIFDFYKQKYYIFK